MDGDDNMEEVEAESYHRLWMYELLIWFLVNRDGELGGESIMISTHLCSQLTSTQRLSPVSGTKDN